MLSEESPEAGTQNWPATALKMLLARGELQPRLAGLSWAAPAVPAARHRNRAWPHSILRSKCRRNKERRGKKKPLNATKERGELVLGAD